MKKLDEAGLNGHVLNMHEPDSKEQAILNELNEQTLDEKGHIYTSKKEMKIKRYWTRLWNNYLC